MSELSVERCAVCGAEGKKTVYNNYDDGFKTVRNLIEIMLLDGGDNRKLNVVKNQAYKDLMNELFEEDKRTLKVDYAFVLYCMQELAKKGYRRIENGRT